MSSDSPAAAIRAALDAKAKPLGSLGRLEDIAVQLGMLQGTARPVVADPVVLVFAGDHGAAPEVSAFPSAVSAAVLGTILDGRSAISVLAREGGARVLAVDAGLAATLPAHAMLIQAKVAPGTADWRLGPAMTDAQCDAACTAAEQVVDGLARGGTTVLVLGEVGIGNTASAALLACKVAGLPLLELVGRGAGLDEAGLARKRQAIIAGASRTATPLQPWDALREYGGFEVAMLAAATLAAAQRGMLVLVDGVIATAAVLVAHALDPSCLAACLFAHRSAERGHDAMLAYLGAAPLMDLGMRLGEGTGAVLALPLVRAAAAVLPGMADLSEVLG